MANKNLLNTRSDLFLYKYGEVPAVDGGITVPKAKSSHSWESGCVRRNSDVHNHLVVPPGRVIEDTLLDGGLVPKSIKRIKLR